MLMISSWDLNTKKTCLGSILSQFGIHYLYCMLIRIVVSLFMSSKHSSNFGRESHTWMLFEKPNPSRG